MKQVFISQPMKGKSDVDILVARAEAAKAAQEHFGEEVTILNSMAANLNLPPLMLLSQAINLLAQADLAYFAEGWEKARGCKIEHMCAVEYGINVLEA